MASRIGLDRSTHLRKVRELGGGGVPVVEAELSARGPLDWRVRYRLDGDGTWAECRVVDITLSGAVVELDGEVPDGPFLLQIDSIAADEVDITVPGVVRGLDRSAVGRPVVELEFGGRREEQLLLHLLVRLHSLA
jgi:hypothetical protein